MCLQKLPSTSVSDSFESVTIICIAAEDAAVHAALNLPRARRVLNLVRGELASQSLLWLLPSPRHTNFLGGQLDGLLW